MFELSQYIHNLALCMSSVSPKTDIGEPEEFYFRSISTLIDTCCLCRHESACHLSVLTNFILGPEPSAEETNFCSDFLQVGQPGFPQGMAGDLCAQVNSV